MIGVEQIRALEDRIEKALAFIANLRSENASLLAKAEASEEARGRADDRAAAAESRVRELEEAIASFRRDQSRIEEGILHALEKLDAFEDLVLRGPAPQEAPPPPAADPEGPTAAVAVLLPEEPEAAPAIPPSAAPAAPPAAAQREQPKSEAPRPAPPQPAADELGIF